MDKESHKLFEQINKSLIEINARQILKEESAEIEKLFDKSDKRVEDSTNQIQITFDRIHDKIFNFNNIMIGAFLVLGTFPSNNPTLSLWTIIFPILNLVFMIWIDYNQMEIHRLASNQQSWGAKEIKDYGNRIKKQTKLSLFSMVLSFFCLTYLVFKVI